MRYSLDTNVLIAVTVRADRAVRRRLNMHRAECGLSSVVLFELYQGAFGSRRVEESLAVIGAIGLPEIEFDGKDARAAGLIRADLKRKGTPIGPYDLLIAGQALARGLVLVTANVGELRRVEGLEVEEWGE